MSARRPGPSDPPTIREIHRRLKDAHGPLDPPIRLAPLEELVLTILSQNTSDVNRDRAWAGLRERFPTWEGLAEARPAQIAAAIRPGGLASTKAPRILAVLREIRRREGGFDVAWMRRASDQEVVDYLISLPGVGPKTAACVLAFSLDRPALPVDTHVHRVATRLGFLASGTSAAKAHRILADLVPATLRVPMHVGLIRHGRTICRAARPLCEECPLRDVCPSAPLFMGGRGP
ncbi:MAG: endonuclease III domain-containing protein [Actinomycetota bacterium]